MVVCAGSTGYWYAGGINIESSTQDKPVSVWKFSHGGDMGGIKAPRTQGWPLQDGGGNRHFRYEDFRLARMCPGCAPSPLACNTISQEGESPRCCVLPPDSGATATNGFDKRGFEAQAPALKSTNANLWEAWHLDFEPELRDGSFGEYDSADLVQARYMFEKLSSAGVSFYISDNTNGLGCDFGNTFAATRALAALSARMNGEAGAAKMHYALSLGVNPLGGPSAPGVLAKMEAQLLSVFNTFINTTDAAAAAIDGNGGADGANAAALAAAAWRHPITKKPAVVLYVEPIFVRTQQSTPNRPLIDSSLRNIPRIDTSLTLSTQASPLIVMVWVYS